jgi:hypothetical protein
MIPLFYAYQQCRQGYHFDVVFECKYLSRYTPVKECQVKKKGEKINAAF